MENEKAEKLKEETQRSNNLQYLGIFGFVGLVFLFLFILGKLNVSQRIAEAFVFIALLLLFEFALILFDPINDQYSGGTPILKLLFNIVIAILITPLHSWLERKIKRTGKK